MSAGLGKLGGLGICGRDFGGIPTGELSTLMTDLASSAMASHRMRMTSAGVALLLAAEPLSMVRPSADEACVDALHFEEAPEKGIASTLIEKLKRLVPPLNSQLWVAVFHFKAAIFPYENPAIVSMPLAFLGIWLFSVLDSSPRATSERNSRLGGECHSAIGFGTASNPPWLEPSDSSSANVAKMVRPSGEIARFS
jgi:hypothetical protein